MVFGRRPGFGESRVTIDPQMHGSVTFSAKLVRARVLTGPLILADTCLDGRIPGLYFLSTLYTLDRLFAQAGLQMLNHIIVCAQRGFACFLQQFCLNHYAGQEIQCL